ncbi:hypothetical protein RHGRI_002395 [Rhododendron griersonianum]|uniref:Uncharacterized protein n=1 Tax=Rhododendron griersonianum TaxID=479676 RepID=A0AAV6LQ08_9ERIC|nr:hypothetical protein RHGRI_002394 [Rhododendron griersonianum]KAG5566835.1 hypothetical protein RHGRI_002395 [Rhododendron griersonianum]
MATSPSKDSNPSNKQSTSFPPKRGQIKARIFESLVKTLSSVALKTGEALGRIRKEGGGGGSTSDSPPPSTYNSDMN